MTATAPATFRKTKTGQWVAFGPITQLHTGNTTITKRDGTTKTVYIEKIGRTFDVDGIQCAYGYIAADTPSAPRRRYRTADLCRACGGHGNVEQELGECLKCHRDFDNF